MRIKNTPHSRCNWLLSNLLVGAEPKDIRDVRRIKKMCDVFVCLTEYRPSYADRFKMDDSTFKHYPISQGRAPTLSRAKEIVREILEIMSVKTVYMHCSGGHGRVGMIGAMIVGKLKNLDTTSAIEYIERSRETRVDTSRNFIPTPESTAQVRSVANYLKEPKDSKLPDRTDRRWLKLVKKERTGLASIRDTSKYILFYTADKSPYAVFSNYYVHRQPLLIGNLTYASVEHYFQSRKFNYKGASSSSRKYSRLIRESSTPNKARELAGQTIKGGWPWRIELNKEIQKYVDRGVTLHKNWENVKNGVMLKALRAKFAQDEDCRKVLLSTGDKILVEHTSRDRYWGDGGDGTGLNMLGHLLMLVRDEIVRQN